MPELTLDALLSFMRASIEGVRADLSGQITALAEQTRVDHGKVQDSIQELGSEMRQIASVASAANALSRANADDIAEHKSWHQRREDRSDGAAEENKRWAGRLREVWKVALGAAMMLAGVLLRAHFA